MDAQDYATVVKSICRRLGNLEPDATVIRNVTQHCKKLDLAKMMKSAESKNDFLVDVVESYISSLAESEEFDYNSYLYEQRETAKQSIDASAPLTNWLSERMPVISSKSMSIYFDSRLRMSSGNDPSITEFGFSLVPRSVSTVLGDGNLQVRTMPSEITYFKLGKFLLPYGVALRGSNFTNELTLTFTGLRSNGIIANEETFHFVFNYTSKNDALVEVSPVNEFCKFSPPLRLIDNLSLRFSDPIVPITFPKDRMYPSSLNYLSSDGRIEFSSAHGLSDNDVVIVNGLKTNDDAANAAILKTINSARGIPITVINSTMISIGVDFTTIRSPDTSSKPLIVFYSKTFRFPLEIGYQDIAELDY